MAEINRGPHLHHCYKSWYDPPSKGYLGYVKFPAKCLMKWCLRTTANPFILGNWAYQNFFNKNGDEETGVGLEIVFQTGFLYFCLWIFVKSYSFDGVCETRSYDVNGHNLSWPFIVIVKHLLICMIVTYIPDNQSPAAWGLTYWGFCF